MTDEKPKIPSYVKLLEDENIEVTTKEGVFVLREPTGEEYEQVDRMVSRLEGVTDFTRGMMLVSKSLVKPKLGELDLKKLKMSTLKRLIDGLNFYGMESADFLPASASGSTPTSGSGPSSS